ncbi:MAG TPA: DUF4350 domain-containing protein [Kofleriaceae bacterium]|nr:DUF4350 domain-containing protein [Kofleriaceae bacterium]
MTAPFSRTTLAIVIGVTALSLAVAGALAAIGDDLEPIRSVGADGYSVSAIGHKGLVELLDRLDVPTIVSRGQSADKARHGVLVIAEPILSARDGADKLKALATGSFRTLIVLPKWYGVTAADDKWVEEVYLQPASEPEAVANALGLDVSIDRGAGGAWRVGDSEALYHPALAHAQLAHDAQTMTTTALTPIVSDGDAVLLGRASIEGTEVWVLSDPDVLNNAGLRDPDNARFVVDMLDELRQGGPVVLDETVHGHAQQPSLTRVLLQFPLVLATFQVLLVAVLAIWAAMVRFGPRKAPPPPLAPGKDFLIANTAALLAYGGHHANALHRYLAASVQAVRHALHAPDGLSRPMLVQWLERVRPSRGCSISLPDLELEVAAADWDAPYRVVELADLVFRWRMEMTRGANRSS